MELFTTFEGFINENSNSNYPKFDEEKWPSYYKYVVTIISEKLGKPNFYSSSADWGGADVWTLKGDKFYGTFLAYLDDNLAILERQEETDENGNTIDNVMDELNLYYPYVEDYSEQLFAIIDKAIAIKNS